MGSSRLFEPLPINSSITLNHRIVLAPLTRLRADDAHIHQPVAVEYYGQRTSVKGTLAITEATFIAEEAGTAKSSMVSQRFCSTM